MFRSGLLCLVFLTSAAPAWASSWADNLFAELSRDFGSVPRGPILTHPFRVVNTTGQAEITSARSDSNYIQLDFREVRRDAGEVSYRISAGIRPDAPPGVWYTDVWLATNISSMPRVRVPLTVQIEAPLSVTPPTIVL